MHEFSLMADLIQKVESIARKSDAARVLSVRVKVGTLSGLSAEHLREHFLASTRGTVAEGADLEIDFVADGDAGHAFGIVLDSLEVTG